LILQVEPGQNGIVITKVLKNSGLVSSITEGQRMIEAGAVRIDGVKIEDKNMLIAVNQKNIFQVGKRKFAKVSLKF